MGRVVDLTGRVFGELTVVCESGRDKWGRKKWLCVCSCGREKSVNSRHLVNGKTKTCGCKSGFVLPKPYLGKKGDLHPKWKGGKFLSADGYWMVYVGEGKYKAEHRIVAGANDSSEIVHHINHIKTDNRPENLEIMDRSSHASEHCLGTSIGRSRGDEDR